jgi:hypothetical protein
VYCHAFLLSTAGVVGLEQPIYTSGRQQESMTIPKAAHEVLEAPDDGRKTTRNMYSTDNNKEHCISCSRWLYKIHKNISVCKIDQIGYMSRPVKLGFLKQ